MDWTSITLLIIVIILTLLILIVKNQTHIKIIVFLIILCNIGVLLQNNKQDTFINYTDILDQIKTFQNQSSNLMGSVEDNLDMNSKAEILTKVEDLNKNIKNLEELLNTAIGMDQLNISKKKINFQTSDKVLNDIELYKQLQLAKLSELQNQLSKTQQIVSSKQNASELNKYKPIKIYSSCIIGNADGTYST